MWVRTKGKTLSRSPLLVYAKEQNDQGRFGQLKYGFYGRIHKETCEDCSPSSQDNKDMGDAPSGLCALPRQAGKGREA